MFEVYILIKSRWFEQVWYVCKLDVCACMDLRGWGGIGQGIWTSSWKIQTNWSSRLPPSAEQNRPPPPNEKYFTAQVLIGIILKATPDTVVYMYITFVITRFIFTIRQSNSLNIRGKFVVVFLRISIII